MQKKILVGYDDSAPAQAALERGIEEARASRGRLLILAVAEMPLDPSQPRNFGTLDDISPGEGGALSAPQALVATLGRARGLTEKAGVQADFIWSAGDPGRAILDAAKTSGARLIVLGEHHHGFLGSFLGGDVAAEVRKHADCDVVLAGA